MLLKMKYSADNLQCFGQIFMALKATKAEKLLSNLFSNSKILFYWFSGKMSFLEVTTFFLI